MTKITSSWRFTIALAAAAFLGSIQSASAQDPWVDEANPAPVAAAPQLADVVSSSSDLTISKPTVADLRLARGQYVAQQRMMRIERNRWAAYDPSRPNWTEYMMMTRRTPYPVRVWVPVYNYPW